MADGDPTKFKIRLNDESPDSQFQKEIENSQLENLTRRIMLFAIFFPCLIGIILAVAYFNIHKKVISLQNTGASSVQSLSQDLESRFSTLSTKHTKLEKSVNKAISSLEASLKEVKTAIRYIRSARKIDNKKFNSQLTKLDKTLTFLNKNLKTVSTRIKTIESSFKHELTKLAKTINKEKSNINKLQADISALSSTKIDQKTLNLVINKQQKKYQQELSKTIRALEDQIESLRKMRVGVTPGPTQPAPAGKTVSKNVTPKPGKIIEKEIKE